MGFPRSMSTIRYTRPVFKHAFRDNFSLSFPRKNCNVPCLDVIMIAIFPRNIHWSSLFARKAHVNNERVPPGHPIILLKFNKINMAAVSFRLSDYRRIGQIIRLLSDCQIIVLSDSPFSSIFGRVSEHATANANSEISVPVSLFGERNALCCYLRHYSVATRETARNFFFCHMILA